MKEVNWRVSVATAVFPLAPCNKSEKKTRKQNVAYWVCTGDNQGKQEPLDEEGSLNYYCWIAQVCNWRDIKLITDKHNTVCWEEPVTGSSQHTKR